MTRFGFSFSPPLRQYDILYIVRLFKQRGYFTVPEAHQTCGRQRMQHHRHAFPSDCCQRRKSRLAVVV